MSSVYLNRIKKLRGYENKNIDKILYAIALSYNLVYNNKIMYRKLYHKIIKPWFRKRGISFLSYKQYSRLHNNNNGYIPKKSPRYLYELYCIMLSINPPISLGKNNNSTKYSDYTMRFEKEKIEGAIIILDVSTFHNSTVIQNEYREFLTSLHEFDECIFKKDNRKLYNEIW